MDGRPNNGTRDILASALVCHRWRRIVRNRVVKYVAAFGPISEPPEHHTTDVSAAAEEQEESAGWSSEGGSAEAGSAEGMLSVASRSQSSAVSLSGSPMGGSGAAAGGRPRRWPLRCRAHVIVAVLRSDGAVPFDLRSVGARLLYLHMQVMYVCRSRNVQVQSVCRRCHICSTEVNTT